MSDKRKIVESASKKFTALPDNQKYYVLGFIHREELDALTKKEKRLLGLQTVVGGTAKTSKESNSLEKADRTKNKN